MAIPLTLISAGLNAVTGLASGIGAAVGRHRAKKEENRYYQWAKDRLENDYYRDPLTTAGNRSLIKSFDERMADSMEAMNNRAAAAGATMENMLAARKANNEVASGFYSNLLRGEDARRQAVSQQIMQNEGAHSENLRKGFMESANNWAAWGRQASGSGMELIKAIGLG